MKKTSIAVAQSPAAEFNVLKAPDLVSHSVAVQPQRMNVIDSSKIEEQSSVIALDQLRQMEQQGNATTQFSQLQPVLVGLHPGSTNLGLVLSASTETPLSNQIQETVVNNLGVNSGVGIALPFFGARNGDLLTQFKLPVQHLPPHQPLQQPQESTMDHQAILQSLPNASGIVFTKSLATS